MWRNKTPPTLVTPYFSKNIDHKTKGDIIMQKKFKIEVDCANCAAKIEDAVKKLPGVNSASVSFMAQKMVLDVDDDKFLAHPNQTAADGTPHRLPCDAVCRASLPCPA